MNLVLKLLLIIKKLPKVDGYSKFAENEILTMIQREPICRVRTSCVWARAWALWAKFKGIRDDLAAISPNQLIMGFYFGKDVV